eukprot:416340_1
MASNNDNIDPHSATNHQNVESNSQVGISSNDKAITDALQSVTSKTRESLIGMLLQLKAKDKLKCYEKWKYWFVAFLVMTIIAVVAGVCATVFAVKHANSFKTESEAVVAEKNILNDLVFGNKSNITQHTNELQKVFNKFDTDNDGVWNKEEFAHHFSLATPIDTMFNDIDMDADDILSFMEVKLFLAKSNFNRFFVPLIETMYDYKYFGNKSSADPLLNQYAASIYFSWYDADELGYITKK